MALTIGSFHATASPSAHPSVHLVLPPEFKIVGGGAGDVWGGSGPGNLLTAAFPDGPNMWTATGKDHEEASAAYMTAYALALYDPQNEWDVLIVSETSDPAHHPTVVATLPDGYVLTGGGARVNYGTGAGNMLTASFPNSDSSWEARGKDQDISDPSTITAYAIGIRHRTADTTVAHQIKSATGASGDFTESSVVLDSGYILSGGGAIDNWVQDDGNFLTSSFPGFFSNGGGWVTAGQFHIHSSPATITAYAIGLVESGVDPIQ